MGVPLNIDWQQILLHLFNFLILAGGLYLLLYKPVKDFMEKRKAYYAGMDTAAKAEKAEAEAERQQYAERLKGAEAEIAAMKRKAAEEAKRAADACLENAKAEKAELLLKVRREAEAEKEKILAKAGSEIEEMVAAAMDKAFAADADPIESFLSKAEKEG